MYAQPTLYVIFSTHTEIKFDLKVKGHYKFALRLKGHYKFDLRVKVIISLL